MGEMSTEEPPVIPEPDPDEPPDDEPISDDEGKDPYEGRDDVTQETFGEEEEVE